MTSIHLHGAPLEQGMSLFQQASELYASNPDLLVVGSVARAVIMGKDIAPYKPNSVARDIDVLRIGDRSIGRPGENDNVDYLFEDWIAEDGTYLVFPHDPTVHVRVRHPEVFQQYIHRPGNEFCVPTPHQDVLGKIGTMQYIQRPKDKKAATEFNEFLCTQEEHLPPELLEPFDLLRNALSQRTRYRAGAILRNSYHRVVPEHIRHGMNLGPRLGWLRSH